MNFECKLILCALALFISCVHSGEVNLEAPYTKDPVTSWTYSPTNVVSHLTPGIQSTPPTENYEARYMGPKQNALIGSPFYGIFPVIFLIGLAAIIIIPLLFWTFSPYGFAYGQGLGRQRSMMDDWDMASFKKHILELAVNVGDAIDKYGGLASAAMSMASESPGKDKPK